MADDTIPEDADLALPDATEEVDDASGATQSLNIGGEASAPLVERPAPIIRGKLDKHGIAMGTGRRKTAVARVRIKDGTGKIAINGRDLEEFFPLERDRNMVKAPLIATEQTEKVDVWVRVSGGGPTGQTGATVLGIARALSARNNALQPKLAEGGYLTRDSRMVERKKYGHKKARRSFQFSKR